MDEEKTPDFGRLRMLQFLALIVGVVTFVSTLYLFDQFREPDIAPIVICVALTGIAFSVVFYFGCLFFEGSLQQYIKEDRTVIKSETVEMVTDTYESGSAEIDEWVKRYVFARNLFGMSVIPLLILGGLYMFG